MRRSKLELYDEILLSLATKPRSLDEIAYKCKTNCILLNQHVEFLIKHNLVEEIIINKKRCYALTRRGTTVHKAFLVAKRLEKLQTLKSKMPRPNLYNLLPIQNSQKEESKLS